MMNDSGGIVDIFGGTKYFLLPTSSSVACITVSPQDLNIYISLQGLPIISPLALFVLEILDK
jgi:hypothetical protein